MPPEGERAPSVFDSLVRHSDDPSSFLALNEGNEYFRDPRFDGTCVFRRSGRHLLQFAGPVAATEQRAGLLDAFVAQARPHRVVAVQLQRADAELYAARGFTVNQLGASYAVELARFTLRGSRFVRLRNKISRARRAGLDVVEADPVDPATAAELDLIDRAWLRGKGRRIKEMRFMVGERTGPAQRHRRLFLGRIGDTTVGYISYSPVFGSRPGWLHDLSRRSPTAPPGVMEALNATAMERMSAAGERWLHFGFTPFTGLSAEHELPSASRAFARCVRLLAEHGERIYPAAAQLDYKEKWAPHAVLPEYIAFQGRPGPRAVWQLLRATRAL
ncbi:bifunctional lysylphosphatidylglycerol flippase/synthetase MprF [Streptomyces sp. CWNU-52B]|uniref:bifunctional lysylphosphatidylglycerol flippase/synthetase MprF n=1 Tax=unclassified Streptomyces TaxID=2593676 RepID=UPI0039C2EE08